MPRLRTTHGLLVLVGLVLVVLPLGCADPVNAAGRPALRSAIFAVACYDVGRAVLQDLRGVTHVSSGWKGRSEVNRVRYDPALIRLDDLVTALRRAGTFIRIVEAEEAPRPSGPPAS